MTEQGTRWIRVQGVAFEAFGEEAVVLHLHAGTYYRLNAVAARAWMLLDTPRRAENLVEELAALYEVDRATLATDVENLLRELRTEALVRESA